ncbi:unnamed protein product [Plutella xylostella]|uniref:(diamondback moth) hypothetical protein n=1 Tax=Plutella xylostella TaxID=51655 RepID=A0A8S4F952_PLUXY|nr:unnamed protein product [Plutella xylostella]
MSALLINYDGSVSESTPLLESNKRFFKLTAEVPYTLFLFSFALTGNVQYSLLLQRTCKVDLNYTDIKCDLLYSQNKTDEAKELECEVEAKTTILIMTLSVICGIIPALISVFLGSWSDRHGRKPLIVWPLFGQFLTAVLSVVYCAVPTLGLWSFLYCAIPNAVLGGCTTWTLGNNLLITDITKENERSLRLAILQGSGYVGLLLGNLAATYMYDAVGYVYTFAISAALYGVCYVYTFFLVEETLATPQEITLKGLVDLGLLKEMKEVWCKERSRRIAYILILLILTYAITMVNFSGLNNIDYLFTRQKFQWLLKEYSIFSTVYIVIIITGMFFGMTMFQKCCNLSDGALLIMAYLSSIAENVGKSLAVKPWQMYLAASMSMLGYLSPTIIRSQVSKVVPKEEIGRIYSLLSCLESVSPVVAPVVFNFIYFHTLVWFPGAVYATAAGLFWVCLVFAITAEILIRKKPYVPSGYTIIEK